MENNEIVKSNNQASSIKDLMSMANLFAESKMFKDATSAAQAFVKIQAGNEIGIPPFQAMSGIHIIQGKTTLGAGVIASMVKGSGKYDYQVKEMTETVCSIDFTQAGRFIGNSTFTIADATKAGTQNINKFPRNMLFARAISNGVKWFAPDVFLGTVYVEGEIEDNPTATHDIPHIDMKAKEKIQEGSLVMSNDDKLYRTPTNDVELIMELIESATDYTLLKTFHAINASFFKTNNELDTRLREKYVALKTAATPTILTPTT
jgi:hypothetical protein